MESNCESYPILLAEDDPISRRLFEKILHASRTKIARFLCPTRREVSIGYHKCYKIFRLRHKTRPQKKVPLILEQIEKLLRKSQQPYG